MKEDVENTFNSILRQNEINIGGSFFKVKDKVLTCNCIINNNIVILLHKIDKQEELKIKEFKKLHPYYKVIVFTSDASNILLLKSADEIYTLNEKEKFANFLKGCI